MIVLRIFTTIFLISLVAYTAVTVSSHGWNLFPFFFGDMAAMNWAGQFNFDFMGFLLISALWTMWRNNFTIVGVALGVLAFFGGMMFLCIYLLYLSFIESEIQGVVLGAKADDSGA